MLEDLLYKIGANVDAERARAEIDNLPPQFQQVIRLFYCMNFSRREIASKLGWNISKVNRLISRGRSILTMKLDPDRFSRDLQMFSRDFD
jgi:DNA-directed RNA polymerase specialized sigma24 family protein